MKAIALLVALLALVGTSVASSWSYNQDMSFSDQTAIGTGSSLNSMWKIDDEEHTLQVGDEDIFTVKKFSANPSFGVPDRETIVLPGPNNDYVLDWGNEGSVTVAGEESVSLSASVEDILVNAGIDPATGATLYKNRNLATTKMESSYASEWAANADSDINMVNHDFYSVVQGKFEDDSPYGLGEELNVKEVNCIEGYSIIAGFDGEGAPEWIRDGNTGCPNYDPIYNLKDVGDLKGGYFTAGSVGWAEVEEEAGDIKELTVGSGVQASIYSWGDMETEGCTPTLENRITNMYQQLSAW